MGDSRIQAMKILVVGGSGYLGQYLVEHLAKQHEVAFTYNNTRKNNELSLPNLTNVSAFQVDLCEGRGFDELGTTFGEPEAVINCAAVSQPRVCEENTKLARSVNIPSTLIQWLSEHFEGRPLLIHMSTDHVYEGTQAMNKEVDAENGKQLNAYGTSKKESEDYIITHYINHLILRSSIIYGKTKNVSRTLFLDWMDKALAASSEQVGFFCNEFRCPIYVMDIVKLIELVLNQPNLRGGHLKLNGRGPCDRIFNLGGPERLSRYDMAVILCKHRGHDASNATAVERPEHVKAPLDASMDISKIKEVFRLEPLTFQQALCEIFPEGK